MAPTSRSHTRSHHLLLLQRLLNLRDSAASPLTLVLDTLEQSAAPLLREFIARAKIGRTRTIFVSYGTVHKPRDVDILVKTRGKQLKALRSEIVSHVPSHLPPAPQPSGGAASAQRALILIDSLSLLASSNPSSISAFLSSIISPAASVVAVYHTDVPLTLGKDFSEYEPHPLTVLCHLATAILRVSNLYQAIESRKAQNRSQEEPEWGLDESQEGVLIGLQSDEHGDHARGIVLDMELRRRSGRTVSERFVLRPGKQEANRLGMGEVILLADHPLFATPADPCQAGSEGGKDADDESMETTFSLGLTDKQRRDRDGVVLPYFDAQTDIGAGEGGRILYEMGREDDFDDEEDEI